MPGIVLTNRAFQSSGSPKFDVANSGFPDRAGRSGQRDGLIDGTGSLSGNAQHNGVAADGLEPTVSVRTQGTMRSGKACRSTLDAPWVELGFEVIDAGDRRIDRRQQWRILRRDPNHQRRQAGNVRIKIAGAHLPGITVTSAGGRGGIVVVTNSGNVHTLGANAHAIMAQSIGGSGGNGAASGGLVSMGGAGTAGGAAGTVTVTNSGDLDTTRARGIFAQSIGGGGGSGCEVVQSVMLQGQTAPFAQLAFGKLSPTEPLSFTAVLPTNIAMPSTVRGTIDENDKQPVELAWTRCLPGGCFASVVAKDDVLKRWRPRTEAGRFTFKNSAGQDLTMPFSFRGLSRALDALAKEG